MLELRWCIGGGVDMFWIAAYRHLMREARAKLAGATDPAERAAYEKQAKQWEARLKEEESRSASGSNAGGKGNA